MLGVVTSFLGAYLSFFLDGATGGVIVVLQTLVFLAAFVLAPKHGLLAQRRLAAVRDAGPADPSLRPDGAVPQGFVRRERGP